MTRSRFVSAFIVVVALGVAAVSLPHHVSSQSDADPIDIILLVDRSASIRTTDPSEARLKAMRLFVTLLQRDRVGIVSFGSDVRRDLDLTTVEGNEPEILAIIDNELNNATIPAQQATDMRAGLQEAYDHLAQSKQSQDAIQTIVLLTDGAPCPAGGFANSGDRDSYIADINTLVQDGRNSGVFLFAFGFLTSGSADPSDPCTDFNPEFMKGLNRVGLDGLGGQNADALRLFQEEPFITEEPIAPQIVDRYIDVFRLLSDIAGKQEKVSSGTSVILPIGTVALFAVVDSPSVQILLKNDEGAELTLDTATVDEITVGRIDSPPGDVYAFTIADGQATATLLYQLDFRVMAVTPPEAVVAGSQIDLQVTVESGRDDASLSANELIERADFLLENDLLDVAIRPSGGVGQGCDSTSDGSVFADELNRADPSSPTINAALNVPIVSAETRYEVVVSIPGLDVCPLEHPLLTVMPAPSVTATPTPSASPSPAPPGSGGLSWIIIAILGAIALLVVLAIAVGLLSRAPGTSRIVDGELRNAQGPGSRNDLYGLKKKRITVGGGRSDVLVGGLTDQAFALFTRPGGPDEEGSVWLERTTELYDIRVTSDFGEMPVGEMAHLGNTATISIIQGGTEQARLEWRRSPG